MDDTAKHQLEGLLKARSEGIRHGRRSRRPREVAAGSAPHASPEAAEPLAPARTCADCPGTIGPRRLRAMPDATRCIECQRAAEPATAPT